MVKLVFGKMMRLPVKMYLLIVIGASVVLYQYHLSSVWVLSHNSSDQEFQNHDQSGKIVKILAPTDDEVKNKDTFAAYLNGSLSCYNLPKQTISALPPLYIITPTFRRPEQIAELTRMAHTLMLIPNVHWLVVEDAMVRTPHVTTFLERVKQTGMHTEHLIAPMPEQYKKKKRGPKPRGVSNRNKGLAWIRANAKTGVFYFADDDNTYDLDLFSEIRHTKKVSMFPVGLITVLGVSSPVVQNGKISGFYDGWIAGRKFPVDMAGFAVSVEFLLKRPNASMPFKPGYEEDGFLRSLAPFEPRDAELIADNCTKILVWHTQTKKNEPAAPVDLSKYNNTNIVLLKELIV